MENRVSDRVDREVRRYANDHRGEKPLYIILPSADAERLVNEVRTAQGFDDKTPVTEFRGSKIVKHTALKAGEIQVSNELPEISG